MRLMKFEGKEYHLSEHKWKQLLKMFDTQSARLNHFGYYSIYAGSICVNNRAKCLHCPLGDSRKKTNSCTYLFRRIIGEELFSYVYLFDHVVMWDAKYDSEARQALQKVVNLFSRAEKVNS